MAFSELIRSFDKIRDYMRDFYIYGFKQRSDFDKKSARTYDDEKRRIESYLGDFIRWSYDKSGKRTFVSLDSASIAGNPLYAAWKSKGFTARDVMLHFYILDALGNGCAKSIEEITDHACLRSGRVFEPQTVRLKCREYVREGILLGEKRGKTLFYALSPLVLGSQLADAIKFFQEAAPLGVIGSFLLDNTGEHNELFRFKHHYIVHTLEDGVLLDILRCMREGRVVRFLNHSNRSGQESTITGVPLKIFKSASTGRRYACMYTPVRRRFVNYRLDYIKSLEALEPYSDYARINQALEEHLSKVWGVSFGGRTRKELLCIKLFIDEKTERYVLERLNREGRGGEVLRLEENVYLYTKELYDTNEVSPWIKTFTGRIISLEGTNRQVIDRFYSDMVQMAQQYKER